MDRSSPTPSKNTNFIIYDDLARTPKLPTEQLKEVTLQPAASTSGHWSAQRVRKLQFS